MAEKTQASPAYDADQIRKLKGLEAVRLRPGMYIGTTDTRGLHHLINEIVDNSVDEALAGHCDEIIVDLRADKTVSVKDNGRGIPVLKNADGEHALYLVFEDLHAGGKFGDGGYKVSGGLHGVGASVTNGLSEWLKVTVRRDGSEWTASWKQGERDQPIKKTGASKDQGTIVVWRYDETIFKTASYDPKLIARYLREKSYLVSGVKFILRVEGEKEQSFYQKHAGLKAFVTEQALDESPLTAEPIYFSAEDIAVQNGAGEDTSAGVEAALQFVAKSPKRISAFTNIVPNPDGGTHVGGLRSALTKALNNYAFETGKLKKDRKGDRLEGDDTVAGLVAAVSVKVEQPQFSSQTKEKLTSPEGRAAVQSAVYQHLSGWLADKRNAKEAKAVLERCLHARKVRLADGKVSKNYNPNSIMADSGQSAKLADCSLQSDPADRELFIVEGDSAGGTAKKARDDMRQAILPLRGKPLNVLTAKNKKIFENTEVQAVISAVGGRVESVDGDNVVMLSPENRRYGKVVLTADADVDGSHITCLLIALFHELMPSMLREGRVFMARPPLFKVDLDSRGEKVAYAYTDEELQELLRKHKRNGRDDVGRFKGLGEMNADQLEETVMDPKTRSLMQVTIESASEVVEALGLILGRNAGPRREFLESGAAAKAAQMA